MRKNMKELYLDIHYRECIFQGILHSHALGSYHHFYKTKLGQLCTVLKLVVSSSLSVGDGLSEVFQTSL